MEMKMSMFHNNFKSNPFFEFCPQNERFLSCTVCCFGSIVVLIYSFALFVFLTTRNLLHKEHSKPIKTINGQYLRQPLLQQTPDEDILPSIIGVYPYKRRLMCWVLVLLVSVEACYQGVKSVAASSTSARDPEQLLEHWSCFAASFLMVLILEKEQQAQNSRLSVPVGLAFCFQTVLVVAQLATAQKSTWSSMEGCHHIFVLITGAVALVFCCVSVQEVHYRCKPSPELSCGLFSFLTFQWLTPVLKVGSTKQLDFEDLPPLQDQDTAESCHKRFVLAFSRSPVRKNVSLGDSDYFWSETESFGESPRVLRRLFHTVAWAWCCSGFWQFFGASAPFITPVALQQVTDYVGIHKKGDALPLSILIWVAAMFVGPMVAAVSNGQTYNYGRRVAIQCFGALISVIMQKTLKLNTSNSNYSVGELTNLMAVDAQIVKEFVSYFHLSWATLLQLVCCIALLFWILGWSALGGVALLILSLPLSKYTTMKTQLYQEDLMKAKDERMSVMNEVLSGIRVIKLFAWERDFLRKIEECRRKELSFLRRYLFMMALIIVQWTSTSSLVGLCTFIFHTQVLHKPLSAGAGFAALSLFTLLRFPLLAFPDMINRAVQAKVSLNRIEEFLKREELATTPRHDNLPGFSSGAIGSLPIGAAVIINGNFNWGDLSLEKVDKEENGHLQSLLGNEVPASLKAGPTLLGINLHIKPGSLVCIYGPTGCGKSSLLMAFLGEIKKTEGSAGTRGSIGYVSQKPWIQNATVRDNILFGSTYNEIKYRGAISACSLRRDLQILEGGDQTEIGEKGITLSGGQQQRVALARAVYADADLYVMDDVLSAVDAHVGNHIFQQCIKGALGKKTRILVTHQVALTIKDADHIILMGDGGVILEQGKPQNLEFSEGKIAEMIKNHGGLNDECADAEQRPASRQSTLDAEGLKLVEDEERVHGAPGFQVYMSYLNSCGGIFAFFIPFLISQIGNQAFEFVQNYSLSLWVTELKEGKTSGPGLWLYVGMTACLVAVLFMRGVVQAIGALKASQQIHDTLTEKVIRAPCAWFECTPLGRILNRFSSDMVDIDQNLMEQLGSFFELFSFTVAIFIVLGVYLPWLILALAPIGVLAYWVSHLYLPTGRELKRLDSTSRSPIYAHFSETISGLTTVRAFEASKRFFQQSCEKVNQNIRANYYTWVANRWLNIRMEMIGATVSGLATLFVVLLAGTIKDTVAGLVLSYATQMTVALTYMIRCQAQLEMQMIAVERTDEYSNIVQEAPAVVLRNRPPENWPEHGELKVVNMTLRYPSSETPVLHNLTFHVPARTRVGIVGRTGAGKSSLTAALFRIVEPMHGRIEIDGINILEIGLEDLRSKLAIVPQDPVLFRGSIRSNLDPFNRNTDPEMWDSLRRVKLSKTIEEMKDGLDTPVTEGGINFSVGQRQLICMARAILRKTAILVMDEATANVDPETDGLIQETMKNEFKGYTVICIAHRLHTIIYYDKIMVLERGHIAEFDSPIVLLKNPESMFHQLCARSGDLDQLKITAAETLTAELEFSQI